MMPQTRETIKLSGSTRMPFSDRQEAIQSLVDYAIAEVDRKYNSDGPTHLYYHSTRHTKYVLEAIRSIGELAVENMRISSTDIGLLEIAAAFHDIEQGLGSRANENASARCAANMMAGTGRFKEGEIDLVWAMILSTKVSFDKGILKQLVLSQQYGYPTHIMADADLATLGALMVIYWDAAERLLFELSRTLEPNIEQRRAFLKNQIRLLEDHRFLTEEAASLYGNQRMNLEFKIG